MSKENIDKTKKNLLVKTEKIEENKFINKMQKIEKFLSKNVITIIAICVLIIGIASIFITAYFPSTYENAIEKTDYKSDSIILNIVFVIIALLIIYFSQKLLEKLK